MAKKPRNNRRATQHADFAGPDAEREAIETLSNAAAKENAKKNTGEISDEAAGRHILLIEASEKEWQEARDKAAELQGVYRNRLKVAKGDGMDVDALKLAFRIKRRTAGEYVSEHRNTGRYLRLMGAPVAEPKGGNGMFDFLDSADAANGVGPSAMDAELQGQAAWRNKEPASNNPFTPGSENFVMWAQGHGNAEGAALGQIGRGNGAEAH